MLQGLSDLAFDVASRLEVEKKGTAAPPDSDLSVALVAWFNLTGEYLYCKHVKQPQSSVTVCYARYFLKKEAAWTKWQLMKTTMRLLAAQAAVKPSTLSQGAAASWRVTAPRVSTPTVGAGTN